MTNWSTAMHQGSEVECIYFKKKSALQTFDEEENAETHLLALKDEQNVFCWEMMNVWNI